MLRVESSNIYCLSLLLKFNIVNVYLGTLSTLFKLHSHQNAPICSNGLILLVRSVRDAKYIKETFTYRLTVESYLYEIHDPPWSSWFGQNVEKCLIF